ncbi:hypothetical protein TURU_071753 [Turdus rufiventris]|nr:hypothetical protein TURU_071753 [Turdus rufiventris]
MASSSGTDVIQVTNVSPSASSEQMRTLFGFLGKIEELRLFPPDDSPLPVSSRVCFVKFHDPDSAVVAQHLTNTVFVDRALIVVPYAEGVIPDETKALSLLAPANAVAGLLPGGGLLPTPNPLSQIGAVPLAALGAPALDPALAALGLPGANLNSQTLQEQIKEKVPFQIQEQEEIQKSQEEEIPFQREEQEVSEHIQKQGTAAQAEPERDTVPEKAKVSQTENVPVPVTQKDGELEVLSVKPWSVAVLAVQDLESMLPVGPSAQEILHKKEKKKDKDKERSREERERSTSKKKKSKDKEKDRDRKSESDKDVKQVTRDYDEEEQGYDSEKEKKEEKKVADAPSPKGKEPVAEKGSGDAGRESKVNGDDHHEEDMDMSD